MHRLWSEGHWNKLTVAHGCYWKQCTFCDVGLNYISRYEMTPTDRLIQQIEQLIAETGCRGFHFVDEAAPPAALKSLALALLEQGITISWWGNIRFEDSLFAGSVPPPVSLGLHRNDGGTGSGIRPSAGKDQERDYRRSDSPCGSGIQRCRHSHSCVSHVRMPL